MQNLHLFNWIEVVLVLKLVVVVVVTGAAEVVDDIVDVVRPVPCTSNSQLVHQSFVYQNPLGLMGQCARRHSYMAAIVHDYIHWKSASFFCLFVHVFHFN